ncbi:MAG: hypothetical protein ABL962_03855 [Fimbriimonadaceae bacterium]
MHTETQKTDPTKNYDTTDLPLIGVLKGLGALAAMAIIAGPVSYWVMIQMDGPGGHLQFSGRPDASHIAPAKLPAKPNPILQDNVTATADIRNLRLKESRRMAEGFDNPETKERTLPVNEALELEASKHGG